MWHICRVREQKTRPLRIRQWQLVASVLHEYRLSSHWSVIPNSSRSNRGLQLLQNGIPVRKRSFIKKVEIKTAFSALWKYVVLLQKDRQYYRILRWFSFENTRRAQSGSGYARRGTFSLSTSFRSSLMFAFELDRFLKKKAKLIKELP